MNVNDIIKQYIISYAEYDNSTRGAVGLDGLKFVNRRILVSLWTIARDKYVKAAQLVGHTLGHYHPHSDQAIYGALVKMHHNGLVQGQGNYGMFTSIDPKETCAAGMRYPEVKWHKQNLDKDMKYIKYADMIPTELGDGSYEPIAIPVRLPLCLVRRNNFQLLTQGIGVGIRSDYLTYKAEDLVKAALYDYNPNDKDISKQKYNILSELTPYLGPDVIIKSFERDKRTLDAKITIAPRIEVNEKLNQVSIYSKTGNVKKVIEKLGDNVLVIDKPTQQQTNIIIKIRPYKRITVHDIVKLIDRYMTSNLSECLYIMQYDNSQLEDNNIDISNSLAIVRKIDLIDWIRECYEYRVKCARRYYQAKLDKVNNLIELTHIIEYIKPHVSTYKRYDLDMFIRFLIKKHRELRDKENLLREILTKYSISKLITYKRDLDELYKQQSEIKSILDNIYDFILKDDYEPLMSRRNDNVNTKS